MSDTAARLTTELGRQVRDLARTFAAEQLDPDRRDAGSAGRLAERLAQVFDMAGGQIVALIPTEQPLACAAGCSACCSLLLLVEAPFVLWLADALRGALDAQTRAAITTAMEREGGPCPLLVDGRCQVYALRPLVCRSHTSIDAAACARRSAGENVAIEAHGGQNHLWHSMANGLAEAMMAAGLGRDVALHFRRAMVVALGLPDASARWAAGDDIFAPARSPLFDQSFRIVHGSA